MTEDQNIELRSEKVRNIIGRVPPELATGGTVYIAFLLFVLSIAAIVIPYPENIRAGVTITAKERMCVHAETLIPYRYITRIEEGEKIYIELEGHPAQKYGRNDGIIEAIEDSLISLNGNSYFRARIKLYTPMKYQVEWNMKGVGTITIADRSILMYILCK